MTNCRLILKSGKVFEGENFGAKGTSVAELVFNTSMVGYQEILSDPAYKGKMILMCYPLIGNYGFTDEDYESKGVHAGGLIVREYNDLPSNFRFTKTVAEVMSDNNVIGLCGIDTRELSTYIRDNGSMAAMLTTEDVPVEDALVTLKKYRSTNSEVSEVSTSSIWYSRTGNPRRNVAVVDLGLKHSLIRTLNQYGCNVTVVPYDISAAALTKLSPDGVLLSSGPGNPVALENVVGLVNDIRGKIPLAGIGLGAQVIALAYKCRVTKLKFGQYGCNHTIRCLESGKLDVVTQSHDYSICADRVKVGGLTVTHIDVLTGDVAAILDDKNMVIGTQFVSDGYTYPNEVKDYLFDKFVAYMDARGGKDNAKENRY